VGRTHEREYGTGGLGEGRGTRGTGSFIIARPLRGGGGAGGPARSGLTLAWTVDTSKILRVHCLRPDLDAVYVFLLFFFALVALLLLENRTRCDRSSIFFHRVNRKSRRLGALRVTMRQRIFSSVRLFFYSFLSTDGSGSDRRKQWKRIRGRAPNGRFPAAAEGTPHRKDPSWGPSCYRFDFAV
jgi:hypothetical protein